MDETKTSDHIRINIRMQNPSQEPPASSKAPKQDLKDRDAFCTFKIKIEGQNSEHKCTIDKQPYANQDKTVKPQSGTSSVLKINLERKYWNMSVLKTSYPDFGFCAFLSKTNLSHYQIWELSFFELTFLSKTNLSQNWVLELSLMIWAVLN